MINLEGDWKLEGLEQVEINNINENTNPVLFSTSDGIYSKNESGFVEFGLQENPIVNVIQIKEKTFLAAIEIFQLESGDTTIFKTVDNGQTWSSFINNYGGSDNKYTMVSDFQIKEPGSSVVFACGGGNIARTIDAGSTWESVFLTWEHLGKANFVKSDIHNSNIIWAGGENAIFEPTLIKSEDGGESWERLSQNLQYIENTIYEAYTNDIAFSANESSNLLLGLSNGILKSKDSGESWENIFNDAAIHTFTHSAFDPEVVYASGINPEGRLFFLASTNFGDTWQTIEYPENPSNIYVNDMVSIMEDGVEVIYLGTNKGLYSFTVE